ncbi:MAG: hypothetical protein FJX75_06355 [Armatimonadetes bacterium]|nr:hypothetical protein [Armatimonadota bacterium]
MVCLPALAAVAGAQQLMLQTEFQYRWVETTSADGERTSYSRFSPLYLLNFTGPLTSGANIQANLGMSGMSSTDPFASVDQRNMRMDLTAATNHLDVFASLSRDTNRVSFAGLGDKRTTFTTATDNLTVTGALSYPRYPNVTFQYARTDTGFGAAGHSTATTWLVAGNYDWGPFRFTADRATESFGPDGGTNRRAQYGLFLDQRILPAVQLSLDHLRGAATLTTSGSTNETRHATTTARLTAYPTPAVVLEGEVGLTDGWQGADGASESSHSRRYALGLRSEVVPGTQLDVFARSQTFGSAYGESRNRELAVDLDSRLGPSMAIGAQWSRASTDFGTSYFYHQESARLRLSGDLANGTRLYGSLGMNRQENELGRSQDISGEIGLTHDLGPALSVSGYYGFRRRHDHQAGAELTDTVHSVLLDARWAPDPRWDVRLGAGVTTRRDPDRSLSVDPYAEVRWSPTYATTVTLRQYVDYHSEQRREEGGLPLTTSRTATGFTARLSHQISERETVEASYEASGGTGGTLDSRKMLQVNYVRTF